MTKIGIVTDSTADLPDEITSKYNIRVVPLTVTFNDKQYLDRVDLTNESFYEQLTSLQELPKTSLPKPELFNAAYQQLADAGCSVIYSIHLASELSGTVNAARLIGKEFSAADVRVWDSRSATIGLGLLVKELAVRIEAGASVEACDAFLEEAIGQLKIYFLIDSLDNLEKGGRIGKAGYLVGSILNIKPILILADGTISVHKKIRGNKKDRVINELTEAVLAEINADQPVTIAAGYNNNKEAADALMDALSVQVPDLAPDYFQIGSVVSTHIGLGACGAAFLQTER
ncbi:DegV family protein [Peptococcus simiae]|uniref:DegV family protein n=1 Tax=Peptococcus simiae TaxID=1643805 RepID=UPI00397E96EC